MSAFVRPFWCGQQGYTWGCLYSRLDYVLMVRCSKIDTLEVSAYIAESVVRLYDTRSFLNSV